MPMTLVTETKTMSMDKSVTVRTQGANSGPRKTGTNSGATPTMPQVKAKAITSMVQVVSRSVRRPYSRSPSEKALDMWGSITVPIAVIAARGKVVTLNEY